MCTTWGYTFWSSFMSPRFDHVLAYACRIVFGPVDFSPKMRVTWSRIDFDPSFEPFSSDHQKLDQKHVVEQMKAGSKTILEHVTLIFGEKSTGSKTILHACASTWSKGGDMKLDQKVYPPVKYLQICVNYMHICVDYMHICVTYMHICIILGSCKFV